MAHGHKFAKLKLTYHQNLAICQNLPPLELHTIYVHKNIPFEYNRQQC